MPFSFCWPPRPLGLGPHLNLVSIVRERRGKLGRHAVWSLVLGVAAAAVIAAIDQVFFDGETARRTPPLNEHPTPAARVAVTFIGGLVEELVFRVMLATAVAAAVWQFLRRLAGERPSHVGAAQWTGTIVAMIAVGVWHVGMVGNPSSNEARVLTINAIGNALYGWTYWRRGLEMSTLTHGVLNATLYLGLPLLH